MGRVTIGGAALAVAVWALRACCSEHAHLSVAAIISTAVISIISSEFYEQIWEVGT